ncbi:MAG: ABC transporter ATP-binding protein [Anaerolineales bacterium]
MKQELVQVDRLSIGYRSRQGQMVDILRSVSLDMSQGEILGLVGESGCGKSTLGLALLGFLRPGGRLTTGKVCFDGVDLFGLTLEELEQFRGKRVALIPQSSGQSLTPTMRVGAQIAEMLTLHLGYDQAAARDRVVELMSQVKLPQPATMGNRYPHELSGGQLQRVGISIALAGMPELLVLDEPTTGLDVTTQAHILALLREIREKTGTAMLYISHDLGVIARVSDRVAVMYAGEIVEDGLATDVFGQPIHPYTRGLLASIPRLTRASLPQSMPGQPPAPGEHVVGCAFAPRCHFTDLTCTMVDPTFELTKKQDGKTPHFVRCHHWKRVAAAEESVQVPDLRVRTKHTVEAEPLIELNEVDITYAKRGFGAYLRRLRGKPEAPRTLSDITLTIYRGETLALVGESGSGKSTIARTITGLLPPCAGRLGFGEHDLTGIVERRPADLQRRIQLIFQNPDDSLNPRHTVRQIIDMPLQLYFKLSREKRLELSVSLLERVRLSSPYIHRLPGQMSGGEKQRVAIARAFAGEPDITLCDEVTSSLDVSVQAAVLSLLADYKAEQGMTYLFISHDLAVVRAIADRVAVLYQGRLCEVGPAEMIYALPYHPYTETLLAAVPEPVPGTRARLLARDVQEAEPPAQGCSFQRRCPRRIGAICDEEIPPRQVAGEGYFIRCHITLEELQASQVDIIRASTPSFILSHSRF